MSNVKHAIPYRRKFVALQAALAALVLALLTACGTSALPNAGADSTGSTDMFDYAMSVEIDSEDTIASVEEQYGGSVVLWRPDDGVAVLGLNEESASGLSIQGRRSLEPNQRAVFMPESTVVDSAGWTAWAGGWSAWAGGWSAWAGGWYAWAGGDTETPTTLGENLDEWDLINLEEAQDLAPNFGSGIKIAVIDTGMDLEHPAFEGRLAPESEWLDLVDGDQIPQEVGVLGDDAGYGHGTGVAGVVAQVAPQATILPIRVLGPDGSGDVIPVAVAIAWAIDQGADIINLSLGTEKPSGVIEAMVWVASMRGIYVVSSAGNTSERQLTYPAGTADDYGRFGAYHVSVGSVDDQDHKSLFSGYGEGLEVLAPGEYIWTLVPEEQVGYWSGTSMAAPMVSGGVALALGEALPQRVVATDELVQTAVNIDDKNGEFRHQLGHGRIDLGAFLESALGGN